MTRRLLTGYLLVGVSIPAGVAFYLCLHVAVANFPGLKEEQAIFWGVASGLVVTVPAVLFNGKQRKALLLTLRFHRVAVVISSVIEILAAWMWWYAFKLSSADLIAFLDQTIVLWGWLLGALFLREKTTRPMLIGMVIALAGFALMSSLQGQSSWLGAALVLGAAFLLALNSLVIKSLAPNIYGFPFVVLVSILFLAMHSLIVGLRGNFGLIPLDLLALLAAGEVCWLVAAACYSQAHRHLPMRTIAVAGLLEPLLVMLAMAIFFSFPLTVEKAFGACIILAGLFFYAWSDAQSALVRAR